VDFDISGAMVFVYIAIFSVFFLALAFLLLRFDKRQKQPHPERLPEL
jgi:preprotein translocase subunit YajC